MNLSVTLQAVARHLPDRPAITAEGQTLTFGDFEDQVSRIAGALRMRHGLKPGDRVGLWMENCLEFLPVLYGVWRAGLTAVPINSKLHPKELQWILENAGARLCIVTPDLADKLIELPLATQPAHHHHDRRRRLSGAARRRSGHPRASRSGRRSLAVLHQRHHRPSEGRCSDPPQSAVCRSVLLLGHRLSSTTPTRPSMPRRCRTAPASTVSRSLPRALTTSSSPAPSSPERIFDALCALSQRVHVRRSDHGHAPHQSSARRQRRYPQSQDHHLWRRADVRRRPEKRARPVRPQALPNLRPGREPDDHRRPVEGDACRHGPSALRATPGLDRHGAHRRRLQGRVARTATSCRPARSARSSPAATAS